MSELEIKLIFLAQDAYTNVSRPVLNKRCKIEKNIAKMFSRGNKEQSYEPAYLAHKSTTYTFSYT